MKLLSGRNEAKTLAKSVGLPCGPISFTQLSTYLLCPRSYYYGYIKRVQRVGWAENLVLGSAMHKMLEVLLTHIRAGTKPDLSLASRAAYTAFLREMKLAQLKKQETEYSLKQYKALEALAKLFISDFIHQINPTGIEHDIWAVMGGIPVRVKIDLIDDNRKVSDFKLSRKMKSERDAYGSLQLSVYAVATEITRTSFITLKFPDLLTKKSWRPAIKEVVAKKTPGDLSWTEDVVASISKSIMTAAKDGSEDAFMVCDPASWKCSQKFCDWFSICRGAERKPSRNVVQKPGWIGGLFTSWNDLDNEEGTPVENTTKKIDKPKWFNDGFGVWNEL